VAILRNRKEALDKIADYEREGRPATTIVNAFELFFGAYKSRDIEKSVKEVYRILSKLVVLPLHLRSSEVAGQFFATLEKKGFMLEARDVMIAGIALENHTPLVTRNRKDFSRIPGLVIEEW
jgi:tRNA(fMet)-specific endonuclease VapC